MTTPWIELSNGLEVKCSVRRRPELLNSSTNPTQQQQQCQCNLVEASIHNLDDGSYQRLSIPCFESSNFDDFEAYLHYYQQLLTSCIYFPMVLEVFDGSVNTLDFVNSLLWPADDAHRCCCSNGFSSDTPDYALTISVRVRRSVMIYPDWEEAGHTVKPTSLLYVSDLVRAKGEKEKDEGDKYESGWSCADHECSICIDNIDKPWNSLVLKCNHEFHEKFFRWLNRNHFCPLCRFEMPSEY